MRTSLRAVPVLLCLALFVASCFGGDEPTSVPVRVTGLAVQPALIPGPADADALPINRIRAVTRRASDGVQLDSHEQDVSPTADSWVLNLSVPVTEDETVVVVFLFLLNVTDGTESVEFSGRSDPITLVVGEEVTPDIPFVRGPLANLDVSGVTITSAPATMVAGSSQTLIAEATTIGSDPPTVFWTSRDELIITTDGSTATAVAAGIATVVASAGAFEDEVSITVHELLTVTTTSLASGVEDSDYFDQLAAAGGVPPYTWAVSSGSLPAELTLDPGTGDIFGTTNVPGSTTFTVQATSSDGQTATRALTLDVYGVLAVATTALPDGGVNQTYGPETLMASGGAAPYTWSLVAGAGDLPTGMTLGADGQVTGVPAVEGFYLFYVEVTSSDGQTAIGQVSIDIRDFGLGRVVGAVFDALTGQVVSGATLSIVGSNNFSSETSSDGFGEYDFPGLFTATYTVTAQASGYVDNTAANLSVVSVQGEVVRADFALPPTTSGQEFGGLSGRVFDDAGDPMPGATVSISGGVQTNGIFRSTTTDADGTYGMVGIALLDASQQPIDQFTVLASASGYQTELAPVDLIRNETVTGVDFTLMPASGQTLFFFQDDFEADLGWAEFEIVDQQAVPAETFWNRSTLDGVTNTAVPEYVSLAPNDPSQGALPQPVQGSFAFWYGDPQTGNFMGAQNPNDTPLSGGTGLAPNQGVLVSPSFVLPIDAAAATLRFDSWFEIESVNPNSSGFDLMTVGVVPESSGTFIELATLNPFVDPPVQDPPLEFPGAVPFTSGGFNATPVWRTDFVDLNQFRGETVVLYFMFETFDTWYNGFRGWLIDNVSVSDVAAPAGAPALAPADPDRPRQSRTSR